MESPPNIIDLPSEILDLITDLDTLAKLGATCRQLREQEELLWEEKSGKMYGIPMNKKQHLNSIKFDQMADLKKITALLKCDLNDRYIYDRAFYSTDLQRQWYFCLSFRYGREDLAQLLLENGDIEIKGLGGVVTDLELLPGEIEKILKVLPEHLAEDLQEDLIQEKRSMF